MVNGGKFQLGTTVKVGFGYLHHGSATENRGDHFLGCIYTRTLPNCSYTVHAYESHTKYFDNRMPN